MSDSTFRCVRSVVSIDSCQQCTFVSDMMKRRNVLEVVHWGTKKHDAELRYMSAAAVQTMKSSRDGNEDKENCRASAILLIV